MVDFDTGEAWRVARVGGAGTGLFVGRTLFDSLSSGSPLVGVGLHILRNTRFADFVFAREGGEAREVVRCHLGAVGEVIECEVWRVDAPAPGPALESGELLALLRSETLVWSVEPVGAGLVLNTPKGRAAIRV